MSQNSPSTFIDRTLGNLRGAWQAIAGSTYDAAAASTRPDLPDDDAERLREQMRSCLETRGGEVSARARSAALGGVYLALDATGRERFLRILATNYDVDHKAVAEIADALKRTAGETVLREIEHDLRLALEAPRVRLLTQFNGLPEGVKFLVDMRGELFPLARGDQSLRALDDDLKALLGTWFDVGFLELRRITWDSASAALLERLIAYEAVHAIESWDDLKNRLDSDRRCFAFFHPRMPDEPLIFVEVALVNGMADNVQRLLDEDAPVQDPGQADTAIFYSISNAQKGLAGISFGNFLIKRVVDELSREFPRLKTFATLSPVTGFRIWLDGLLDEGEPGLLTQKERKALKTARPGGAKGSLKSLLTETDWHHDDDAAQALRGPVMRLGARYLMREARTGGRPLDPVAHFHLSNGARMGHLNWLGDTSSRGMREAAGLMINYVYELDDIEDNHEAYRTHGERACSSTIRGLLKD
jgi:malonyl-CoA decarboxylase